MQEQRMPAAVGDRVLYVLSEQDAKEINRRRTSGAEISERIQDEKWPHGAQAHIGSTATAGDILPLDIVRVWPNEFGDGIPGVNGQVLLDGSDRHWVTSVREAPADGSTQAPPFGTWYRPPK